MHPQEQGRRSASHHADGRPPTGHRPLRRRPARLLPAGRHLVLYLGLTAGALLVFFPFVWMLLTALKTLPEINRMPPDFWPGHWQWANYLHAWLRPESTFGRYLFNSAIFAIGGTCLQLLLVIPAAYAFSHLEFPGRDALFGLVLATMMIPFEVTLIPNFITIRHLPLVGGNDWLGQGGQGLYDSYLGMMLPYLVGAFAVFMLRQFFRGIPREYWEAAQIDGCGRWQFLWRVLVPLARPAIITVGLFGLLSRWNALTWPLIATASESMRPVQVGLLLFSGEEGANFHHLMAAATLATLPGVLLYLSAQRWFDESFTASGVKG